MLLFPLKSSRLATYMPSAKAMITIFSLPPELHREIADILIPDKLGTLASLLRTCRYFLNILSEKLHTEGLLTAHHEKYYYCRRLQTHLRNGAKVNTFRTYRTSVKSTSEREVKKTALHVAVWQHNISATKLLLEKGANVNAISIVVRPSSSGTTNSQEEVYWESALFRAIDSPVKWGNEELVRLLLEHGADVGLGSSLGGPLHAAVLRAKNGVDIARILVEAGADVNALHEGSDSGIGGRPVHAAFTGATTRYLLENGADINGLDRFERTALFTTFAKLQIIRCDRGREMEINFLTEKAQVLQEAIAVCMKNGFEYDYDWEAGTLTRTAETGKRLEEYMK